MDSVVRRDFVGGHAVVIGGSLAGLLAVRVLSDYFERVTLIERDILPRDCAPRKGVPQGYHAHALLAGGREVVEGLFPGIVEELVANGATSRDTVANGRWHQPGGYRLRFISGIRGVSMSRPFLEGHVRRRVRALGNVAVADGCRAVGLISGDGGRRVVGVLLRGGEGEEGLGADLVVDAGGRGSKAPAWLESLGYERPEEEEITVKVSYTTRIYVRRPQALPGATFSVIQAEAPDCPRYGVLLPLEGERWMVTLGGMLGVEAPTDEAGFVAFAKTLAAPDIHNAIKDARPLGEARTYRFPKNLRRRYERLEETPDGYIVTGDALCSFNPVYGQGMSVAALEAAALGECLSDGDGDLPRRFYERAAKVIDTPWSLAAGADLAFPEVVGSRTRGGKLVGRYVAGVMRAATRDEMVCLALVRVTNLLESPAALFRPGIVWRVARDSLFFRRKGAREKSVVGAPPKPTGETREVRVASRK